MIPQIVLEQLCHPEFGLAALLGFVFGTYARTAHTLGRFPHP